MRNKHEKNKEGLSPIEKLTNAKKTFEMNDNHAFGYPSCVLTADLQDEKSDARWDERIRKGAHLGTSK